VPAYGEHEEGRPRELQLPGREGDERQVAEHERVLAHPARVRDRERRGRRPRGGGRGLGARSLLPGAHGSPHAQRQLDGDHVVHGDERLRDDEQDQEVARAHRLIERQQPETTEHHEVRDAELRPQQDKRIAPHHGAHDPVHGILHPKSVTASAARRERTARYVHARARVKEAVRPGAAASRRAASPPPQGVRARPR
jgi:hypothetical protein